MLSTGELRRTNFVAVSRAAGHSCTNKLSTVKQINVQYEYYSILPIAFVMSILEGSMGSVVRLNVREPLIHNTADLISENDNFVLNQFVTILISESNFSASLFPSSFMNLSVSGL